MKTLKILSLLTITLLINSCGIIMKNLLGFETIRGFDLVKYNTFISNFQNDKFNVIFNICDSSRYVEIAQIPMSDKFQSLTLQPMKSYLFINEKLEFFIANCLVPPKLSNLNWNYQNKFNYFPPINSIELDSFNMTLIKFNGMFSNLYSESFKYVYIVDWTLMAERQSKNLIEQIFKNVEKFNKQDSTLIILNNVDDFFIKNEVEF
jgi:hypothetical protein